MRKLIKTIKPRNTAHNDLVTSTVLDIGHLSDKYKLPIIPTIGKKKVKCICLLRLSGLSKLLTKDGQKNIQSALITCWAL